MESNLIKRILLELSSKAKLFRNNTGTGWQGASKREGNKITIYNPRPLRAGLIKGSSDIIGWTMMKITPEMVGKTVAIFTAIEVKTGKTRVTKEQAKFLQILKGCGGIAGVARSPEDAKKLIDEFMELLQNERPTETQATD